MGELPPRILDVARARAEAGLPVGSAEARVVAAWIIHLTTDAVRDPPAQALASTIDLSDPGGSAREALALLESDPSRIDPAFVAEVVRHLVITTEGAR